MIVNSYLSDMSENIIEIALLKSLI